MSIQTQSETRTYGRVLTYTKDAILPGIKQNAYDLSPLMAAILGRLTDARFGPVKMNGRGKQMQDGGATVQVFHRLGKNATAQTLPGPWGLVDTTPQDNVRFSRANWVHYSSTATISEFEQLINKGDLAIARIVEEEVRDAMNALVDLVSDHLYSNGGDATRVTSLQQLTGANDTVQSLSGSTYGRWNSRGVSARGTAPSAVSFASGSFAAQGITDMRKGWLNAMEGAIQPQALYTTHAVFGSYEASLQPLERFTSTDIADAGFQQLAFKTAPVFADSKCASGEMHFANFDATYLVVLDGADFASGDFIESIGQEAMTSKCMSKIQMVTENRLFTNKLTGITA